MSSHRKSNFVNNFFSGVVCICSPAGVPLGTGFLIDCEDLVITCAHVLQDRNNREVGLKFWGHTDVIPAVVHNATLNISKDKDIAILRPLGDIPKDSYRLILGPYIGSSKELFTMGFPFPDNSQGVFAGCEVIGVDTRFGFAMLQIRSQEITLGFSGAPIVDRTSRKVIAVVTSIVSEDKYGKLAETAFAISALDVYTELLKILPEERLMFGESSSVPTAFLPFVNNENEGMQIHTLGIAGGLSNSDLETAIINAEDNPSLATFRSLRTILLSPRLLSILNVSQYVSNDFTTKVFVIAAIDTVYVIDSSTLKIKHCIKLLSQPTIVALSDDGYFLAIAHRNGTVSVWRTVDGACMVELSFDGKIEHISFSSSEPAVLCVGTWTKTTMFRISDTIDQLWSISHTRLSKSLWRGRLFAGLDLIEKNISVWDLPTGSLITTINIEYPVSNLQFADDKSMMLLGVVNGELRWWNIHSGQAERKLALASGISAFSKDQVSDRIVVTFMGGEAGVVDINQGKTLLSRDFSDEIQTLSIESDCNKAVVAFTDRIVLWDLLNDECMELHLSNSGVRSVFLLGSVMVICRPDRVEFWDTRVFSRFFTESARKLSNLSVSKGLNPFLGASRSDSLRITDIVSAVNTKLEFRGTKSLDFNNQGTMLIACNTMPEVAIWDLQTMEKVKSNSIYDVALLKFLGDTNVLMVDKDYATLNITGNNFEEVHATLKLTKKVETVAGNIDGTIFGIYFTDGEFGVYETHTCKQVFQLVDKSILGFFFSSNTECLVISSHSIKIVDVTTGKDVTVGHFHERIFGVDFHIWSGSISVNFGKSVGIFNMLGKPLAKIDFENTIQRVNLMNNGRWLMVIDDQDVLSIYPCTIRELREVAVHFLSSEANLMNFH